jgi:hypothetical protein
MSTYLDNLREYIVKCDELIKLGGLVDIEDEAGDFVLIDKIIEARDEATSMLYHAERLLAGKQLVATKEKIQTAVARGES